MSTKIGCGAIILTSLGGGLSHPVFEQLDGKLRILLIRRGFGAPTFPGAWACPAGIAEQHESPSRAAEREALEEVDVLFAAAEHPFYVGEWNDRKLEYYTGLWSFRSPEGVRLSLTMVESQMIAECIGFDWCTYEEAMEKELAFRWREAIQALHDNDLL